MPVMLLSEGGLTSLSAITASRVFCRTGAASSTCLLPVKLANRANTGSLSAISMPSSQQVQKNKSRFSRLPAAPDILSPPIRTNRATCFTSGNRRFWAHPFDAAREELTVEPFPIAENIYSGGNRQSCDFSVSASGVLTYRQGDTRLTRRITWFNRQGKKLGTVGDAGVYGGQNLSPGGERLAFRATDLQTGNMDIWVRELWRGVATRLTFHEAVDFRPVWSPDGTRIAFFGSSHKSVHQFRFWEFAETVVQSSCSPFGNRSSGG